MGKKANRQSRKRKHDSDGSITEEGESVLKHPEFQEVFRMLLESRPVASTDPNMVQIKVTKKGKTNWSNDGTERTKCLDLLGDHNSGQQKMKDPLQTTGEEHVQLRNDADPLDNLECSSFIDVTTVDSQPYLCDLSDMPGHEEEEFPYGTQTEKKTEENCLETIRKEDTKNKKPEISPSRCLNDSIESQKSFCHQTEVCVSSPANFDSRFDFDDDDITEAADLIPYIRGNRLGKGFRSIKTKRPTTTNYSNQKRRTAIVSSKNRKKEPKNLPVKKSQSSLTINAESSKAANTKETNSVRKSKSRPIIDEVNIIVPSDKIDSGSEIDVVNTCESEYNSSLNSEEKKERDRIWEMLKEYEECQASSQVIPSEIQDDISHKRAKKKKSKRKTEEHGKPCKINELSDSRSEKGEKLCENEMDILKYVTNTRECLIQEESVCQKQKRNKKSRHLDDPVHVGDEFVNNSKSVCGKELPANSKEYFASDQMLFSSECESGNEYQEKDIYNKKEKKKGELKGLDESANSVVEFHASSAELVIEHKRKKKAKTHDVGNNVDVFHSEENSKISQIGAVENSSSAPPTDVIATLLPFPGTVSDIPLDIRSEKDLTANLAHRNKKEKEENKSSSHSVNIDLPSKIDEAQKAIVLPTTANEASQNSELLESEIDLFDLSAEPLHENSHEKESVTNLNEEEFEAKNVDDDLSRGDDLELSAWHRLTCDSNGPFTCTGGDENVDVLSGGNQAVQLCEIFPSPMLDPSSTSNQSMVPDTREEKLHPFHQKVTRQSSEELHVIDSERRCSSSQNDNADIVTRRVTRSTMQGKSTNNRCTRCYSFFETPTEMLRHDCTLTRQKVLPHRNNKPRRFECDQCERTYIHNYHLNVHVKTVHLKIRNYTCELCNMKFGVKQSLVTHMRTHTGSMPHKCAFCQKSFRYTHHLSLHYSRIHYMKPDYPCAFCHHSFYLETDLENHLDTIHSKKTRQMIKTN